MAHGHGCEADAHWPLEFGLCVIPQSMPPGHGSRRGHNTRQMKTYRWNRASLTFQWPRGFGVVWRMCGNSTSRGEAGQPLTDKLQVDGEDLCARLSGLQGHIPWSCERWGPCGRAGEECNGKNRRQVLTCQRTRGGWALGNGGEWQLLSKQNAGLLLRSEWGLLWAAVCVRYFRRGMEIHTQASWKPRLSTQGLNRLLPCFSPHSPLNNQIITKETRGRAGFNPLLLTSFCNRSPWAEVPLKPK